MITNKKTRDLIKFIQNTSFVALIQFDSEYHTYTLNIFFYFLNNAERNVDEIDCEVAYIIMIRLYQNVLVSMIA